MPKGTKAIKVTDIKADKPWLKKIGVYKYPVESLDKKKRFLIVCEGQTEELYFKSFPVVTADIKPVHQGSSKSDLVACTHAYAEGEDYDEIWCVFDMDFKPGHNKQYEDYNNAINAAQDAGYKCAYSNDAFELWFILHYKYLDQALERSSYFKMLSDYWNMSYERQGKIKAFAGKIYARLLNDENASQEKAIINARKLYDYQKEKVYHQQNPVTTVFFLVEEINKHLRR